MINLFKRWGALILGVFSALSWLLTAWFRRKARKTKEKLEETKEELATEQVKVEVKEHETEAVKEAAQHEKQSNQKEQEQIEVIKDTETEQDTIDSINDMLSDFNARV